MSTVTLQGQATFAFHRTIRCAIQYLENTGNHSQIPLLPESYPQHKDNLNGIDVVVKAKIFKAHLEDAYPQNVFSVSITRRKDHCTISVCHDLLKPEMMAEIVQLYENDTTKIRLDTFVYNTCEQ